MASVFWSQYRRLTQARKEEFNAAVRKLVADLRAGKGFRKSLGVKKYQGQEGVFEMRWAPDGRALFRYGDEIRRGERHVVWLQIGGHAIYDKRG
jgi:hypothetical protein